MVLESRNFSHSGKVDQSPSLKGIKNKCRPHLARRKHPDRKRAPQHDSLQEHVSTSKTIAPPNTLSKQHERLTQRKKLRMWQQDLRLEGAQDTWMMCVYRSIESQNVVAVRTHSCRTLRTTHPWQRWSWSVPVDESRTSGTATSGAHSAELSVQNRPSSREHRGTGAQNPTSARLTLNPTMTR